MILLPSPFSLKYIHESFKHENKDITKLVELLFKNTNILFETSLIYYNKKSQKLNFSPKIKDVDLIFNNINTSEKKTIIHNNMKIILI